MSMLKTAVFAFALVVGSAIGIVALGSKYADEATSFQKSLDVITEVVSKKGIPDSYQPEKPDGFLARLFEKHPNNGIVKGLFFVVDPDGFAESHPNNEVGRAYQILIKPKDFIKAHPNNQLAHALQILIDTEGFYTDHPHNDLARTLHIFIDPDDFIEKHPNNELGKAMQLLKGDIDGFVEKHPNNEISRVKKEIDRIPKNIKKCFGLC